MVGGGGGKRGRYNARFIYQTLLPTPEKENP